MQLTSFTFILCILPLLLVLYYLLPDKLRTGFLFFSSLLLYGFGNPARMLYPAVFLCYDYGFGFLLEKCRNKKKSAVSLLCFSVLIQVSAMIWIRNTAPENSFYPFGITFYTLQGLGYLIGIYQNAHAPAKNLFQLGLYLFFFPCLFAGGLFSYETFSGQIQNRKLSIFSLGNGLGIFIRGLTEKVVLADTFGYIFRELQQIAPENMSMLTAWLNTVVFSMYLYFELTGYSEMARGLGACFGYELPRNFNHPIFTPSITALMQSWNVTLSDWFRTHFQKNLFPDTDQKHRFIPGFLLMWFLTGTWYGTGILFSLWGLIIGILLLIEKYFLKKLVTQKYIPGVFYTGMISQFLWVLFFSRNFREAGTYWKAMLGFQNGIFDSTGIYFLISYIALILIGLYIATDLFKNILERLASSEIGEKISSFMPLVHSGLFIFCIASMLYREQPLHSWLWL